MSRIVLLICASLTIASSSFAAIRESNVPTLERLGNELTRVSQRADSGASDPVRKQAQQTAIAALRGRLFKLRYDYVVMSDPDGKRLLVYALGKTGQPGEFVLAGHVRVTVSADGTRVEQIDRLSETMLVASERNSGLPAGYKLAALYFNQIVSKKPVETFIYLASLARKNIYVQTPNGKLWVVNSRSMEIDHSKPTDKTEAGAAHKAFDR
jgi:hypothetical protein